MLTPMGFDSTITGLSSHCSYLLSYSDIGLVDFFAIKTKLILALSE